MSHKKKIGAYQKKQAALKKKEAAKKRNLLILAIVSAVVIIATLITVVAVVISRLPVKVALEVENYGTIVLELYPAKAPISVKNFVNYVEDGFYDGSIFHRVIEGFMIQGGAGAGDSSLKTIKGEFSANGVDNDLKFERGVIGMARSGTTTDGFDTATSQFFICHKTTPTLDGQYAAFGKVIEGMDVVDAIATCEKTDVRDNDGNYYIPKETVKITKAYVL